MGKAAAEREKRTTTNEGDDPAMNYLAAFDAKSQLLMASVNIGWRLALTVLIPLFIGVQLDKKFNSTPSITLAAFFIAIFGAGVIINKTYNEINARTENSKDDSSKSGKGKND